MSRVYPFSNGTEYHAWTGNNCEQCAKAGDYHETGMSPCPILDAVLESMGGGGVTRSIARRMGYLGHERELGPACSERVHKLAADLPIFPSPPPQERTGQ